MSIIAFLESKRQQLPVIHMFNGITANQFTSYIQTESSDAMNQLLYNNKSNSIEETFKYYEKHTNRKYSTFEYFGPSKPTQVIVLVNQSSSQKDILQKSLHQTKSTGVILVRLYRPWNKASFLSVIPSTTQQIYIPKQSNIFTDITGTIYQYLLKQNIIIKLFTSLEEIVGFQQKKESNFAIDFFDFSKQTINDQIFSSNNSDFSSFSLFQTINAYRKHGIDKFTVVSSNLSTSIPETVNVVCCKQKSLLYDDILLQLTNNGILVILEEENETISQISQKTKDLLLEKQINLIITSNETSLFQNLFDIYLNQFDFSSFTISNVNLSNWLESKEFENFYPSPDFTLFNDSSILSKSLVHSNLVHKNSSNHLLNLYWRFMFPECYQSKQTIKPEVKGIFHVTLTKWVRLTPENYDRNVFHMEMDISSTLLKYDIGDALGVYGENDESLVFDFIQRYKADPNEIVVYHTESKQIFYRTLQQLLIQDIDLFGRPTKRFYADLAKYATNSEQANKLQDLGDGTAADEFRERFVLYFY